MSVKTNPVLRYLKEGEGAAVAIVKAMKAAGWLKTRDQEMAAGQMFFSRMAMSQLDSNAFGRLLAARTKEKELKILERKLALLVKREKETKEIVSNTTLTPEQKEARVKEILGIE